MLQSKSPVVDEYRLLLFHMMRLSFRRYGKKSWGKERQWIFDDNSSGISFGLCCDYLGLNCEIMREYVNALPNVTKIGKHNLYEYVIFLLLIGSGVSKIEQHLGLSEKMVKKLRKGLDIFYGRIMR